MSDPFIRTRLLIGDDPLDRLSRARVAVFGVGGVGGFCVEALARAGVGALEMCIRDSPFNDIGGGAHAHEIPGLFLWHMRLHRVDDVVHGLGGLPHRQTADGIAIAVQLGDVLHMTDTDVGIGAPLVDAE